MILFAVEASLPTTLWGWVAVAGVLGGLTGGILATLIRTARAHIGVRVDKTCEEVVQEELEDAMKPFEVKIDTFGRNLEESVRAIMDGNKRIEALEVTINNGLTHATHKTTADVAALSSDVSSMKLQLAEIHGWLKASHTPWDGQEERRTGG